MILISAVMVLWAYLAPVVGGTAALAAPTVIVLTGQACQVLGLLPDAQDAILSLAIFNAGVVTLIYLAKEEALVRPLARTRRVPADGDLPAS